jgi:hypothetical protein
MSLYNLPISPVVSFINGFPTYSPSIKMNEREIKPTFGEDTTDWRRINLRKKACREEAGHRQQ